jgi:hypothetical protein
MKRTLTWPVIALLLGAFTFGCGGSGVKDPPKDIKIAPAEKTQNKARGGMDSETIPLPKMPKQP